MGCDTVDEHSLLPVVTFTTGRTPSSLSSSQSGFKVSYNWWCTSFTAGLLITRLQRGLAILLGLRMKSWALMDPLIKKYLWKFLQHGYWYVTSAIKHQNSPNVKQIQSMECK